RLDFADLEHNALLLLTEQNNSTDKLKPSQTATALRKRYKYIFVDEYQDINPVQQAILDMISSGGNIFAVGDIKQSIYAFRGAKPEIFLNKLNQKPSPATESPESIQVCLNANFRSSAGILDFVNKVFSRIMSCSLSKIDYNRTAMLQPAADVPSGTCDKPLVELHILDKPNRRAKTAQDEMSYIFTSRQHQAVMIAQRIRQMVGAETGKGQFQIFDKGLAEYRDIRYGDIAILMR
ncbi:unnamed protein product, partial [marine sediment metagenome]